MASAWLRGGILSLDRLEIRISRYAKYGTSTEETP